MATCTGVARGLAIVVLVTAQMVAGRNKAADSATEKSNDNEHLQELLGTLENYQDTDNDGLYEEDYFDNYPEPELVKQGRFKSVANWPKQPLNVGQVVGLAVDGSGRPVLFHRAGREWEADSFDDNTNKFQKKGDGAIKNPTVAILNQTDGRLLKAWGENMFYLPHGLAIDSEGNYWMADVALHQVLKFEGVATEPSMTLGKAFEPATSNDDKTRFCKPTDVAVASSGEVFVSDGYCNSRIVKFDKDGKYLGQMGDGEFNIPHGIALAEDHDILCVADRENLRVLCLNAGLKHPERFGEFDRVYSSEVVGPIYGIAYSPKDHLLYGVNGPTLEGRPRVITIDLTASEHSSAIAVLWPDQEGFFSPHDIAVSPDGNNVYVGEVEPHRVWKFEVERP